MHSPRSEASRLRDIIETQRLISEVLLNPDELMRVVAERTQELTGAAGGVVELLEGDDMVYRAATGTASSSLGARLGAATSLSGLCARLAEVLRCDDAEADPRVDREACRRIGVRSMIVAPLVHAGEAVGVLKVLSPEPGQFDDTDIDTLELMAGFIASSFQNAWTHADEARRSLHDQLTGLANRALFRDRLGHDLRNAVRTGGLVAVLYLDLDGFKSVNDTYGHAAGDDLLRAVAAELRTAVRESDTVARLGGDEFAISCPSADRRAIEQLGDRVRAAVRSAAAHSPVRHEVSASVGVAWNEDPASTVDELLAKADAGMYAAKRAAHTAPA
jgi:diguanylate cyclase (GGDEF)-like protein